jgi:hypothetical protein
VVSLDKRECECLEYIIISCSFHTFYIESPHSVDAGGHHTLQIIR